MIIISTIMFVIDTVINIIKTCIIIVFGTVVTDIIACMRSIIIVFIITESVL